MPYLTLNELNYYYECHGHGGEPLLLLHGFTGSMVNWQPLLPALTPYYQVLLLDLPGHGRTAAPPDPARYGMAAVAADVWSLLDAVCPGRVHLLGYSMGGRLALYLAVRQPARLRRLILESASPGLATAAERGARRAQDERLAARIEQVGMTAFVDEWERLPLWASQAGLSPAGRARLREQRLRNDPAGLANSLRGMGTGAQPSLWEALPALRRPVRLLAGALDSKFVAINRQMAALLPQADLRIIPGAGHTIHLEKPALFLQAVREGWPRENGGADDADLAD